MLTNVIAETKNTLIIRTVLCQPVPYQTNQFKKWTHTVFTPNFWRYVRHLFWQHSDKQIKYFSETPCTFADHLHSKLLTDWCQNKPKKHYYYKIKITQYYSRQNYKRLLSVSDGKRWSTRLVSCSAKIWLSRSNCIAVNCSDAFEYADWLVYIDTKKLNNTTTP